MRKPLRLAPLTATLILATVSMTAAETRDPKAVELAKAEMDAAGGKSWEKARYLRFDFLVDTPQRKVGPFAHYWDRWTGRYRLDVPGDDGYTAYFNVNDLKNPAAAVILKKGQRVTGEDAWKIVDKAFGRYINDSYWLLAPLKVLDPGVSLADEGDSELDGRRVHVIRLSFEAVGLTPGDVYKHFLDPETGRMVGWEYQLQNTQPPPTRWKWVDVKDYGGLMLSTRKVNEDGTRAIRFENVAVSATADEAALKPPSP